MPPAMREPVLRFDSEHLSCGSLLEPRRAPPSTPPNCASAGAARAARASALAITPADLKLSIVIPPGEASRLPVPEYPWNLAEITQPLGRGQSSRGNPAW